jgi:hypothetical protein
MQLTAGEFAELIEAVAKGVEPAGNTREQRRAPRVPHRTRVEILPYNEDGPGRPMLVSVKDFSPRGICIVSPKRMDHGRVFVARLPRASGIIVSLLYSVVHCDPAGGTRQNRIGAELICVLNDDQSTKQDNDPATSSSERAHIQRSVLD